MKKIITIFFVCILCLGFKGVFAYAAEEYMFHSTPEAYPESVEEGIELANEYASQKLIRFNMENNLYFPERMRYKIIEDNKKVDGEAYLNNMYEFSGVSEDKILPSDLKNKPLTNNVMENLILKKAFSIIYEYPLKDWKVNGKEPRYLGRSISGQRFSNMFFPPDSTSSSTPIEEKKWIKKPWGDEKVKNKHGVEMSLFQKKDKLTDPNYQKRLEKLIIKGIEFKIDKVAEEYKSGKISNNYFKSKNEGYKNMGDDLYWFNRVAIIQPPTKYTWGMGIIYHESGGTIWYQDMYIHPDTLVDLSMSLELEDSYTVVVDEEDKDEYITITDVRINTALNTELTFGAKGSKDVDVYVSDVEEFKVGFQKNAENMTTGNEIDIKVDGSIDGIKSMTEEEKINIFQIERGTSLETTVKIPKRVLKQGNNKVKLTAEGLITIKNEGTASAVAEKIININYIKPVRTNYVLDYDEYTKEILHPYNKGAEVEATLSEASPFDRWIGSTNIRFNRTGEDASGVIIGSVDLLDVPKTSSSSSVSIIPKIKFTTGRAPLGDNPPQPIYHVNGETPYKTFIDTYGGGISRCYEYKETVNTGHNQNCPENCTASHTTTKTRQDTRTADFEGGVEYISIKAKVYNGSKIAQQQIGKGEENTGNAFIRKIFWEGNKYDIPVQRFMKNVDIHGNTKDLVAADGQFKRVFQHRDTAEVTYKINESIAQHFAADRKAAKEGRTKSFKYAPFATDKFLQNLWFPLKSGYNYTPHGQYTATVRTEIYKKGTEATEHQKIVDSVVKSFGVRVELPTVNLKGQKITTYPVDIKKSYKKVSDEKLAYKTGPSSVNEYLNGNESTLLGNTNDLFKKILEGWSFSGTQNSWMDKKYREYVKSADIHKIVEETVITFTINPAYEKFNTPIVLDGKNVKDGDYFIRVYFNGFENGHANKVTSTPINPSNSWTKTYNPNDGWNMVINIRGTRHEDMGFSE